MTDAQGYDEQVPWLEAVDDEDGPSGLSARKMMTALAIVGLAVAIIAVTFFLLGRHTPTPGGVVELIKADPAPYKIKPSDPGGLDISGDSGTAFATSAGEDTDPALAGAPPASAPEPVVDPAAKPKKLPENETKVPAPPDAPAPGAATLSGPSIQLGAYASTVKADTAWSLLSGRFPSVAALSKQVIPATVGGKTIYRLRAAGSTDATKAACSALKAGGESCLPVN